MIKKLIQRPSFFLFFQILMGLLVPPVTSAYQILFYYNSGDGTDGALLQCVTILQNVGHQVTPIDVQSRNHDPRNDNWGPPYDQVWDMRFVDRQSSQCGSGKPNAADYFDENWLSKSVSFLNHGGKLFVAGEHYLLPDRDEGLYTFLKEIQGVKKGFDSCPPSARGNSTTDGEAFYPVRHGLGPVSFYGAWVGGIPLAFLTGTSFVDTDEDWEDDDVDRSVVSGWDRKQLGGAVTAGFNCRGKLFMVWDATMWTLWQPGMYAQEEVDSPIWDDSAWIPGNIQSPSSLKQHVKSAKKITTAFFPAVVNWLGSGACPCTESLKAVIFPSAPIPLQQIRKWPTPSPTFSNEKKPPGSLLTASSQSITVDSTLSSNAPETIVFHSFPINVYIGFRDGIGEYQLSILNSQRVLMQVIFDKTIVTEKECWAAWNGEDLIGREVPVGLYYAFLSKDGRFLRKIVLVRVQR